MMTSMTGVRPVLLGSLMAASIGIGVFVLQGRAAPPAAPVPLPAAEEAQDPMVGQRTKGRADAPITIYEMSDFQCPFCRKQALEVLPLLEKEFITTGKVRWIFMNLPLTDIHTNASAAAEFAMCAAKVDKFWPVHDLLFTYQSKWAPLKDPGAFLLSLADSAGIARESIVPCLESGETRVIVKGEAEGAAKAGISKTPSAYIEGAGLVPGAAPIELYREVLDSLWKDRTKAKS